MLDRFALTALILCAAAAGENGDGILRLTIENCIPGSPAQTAPGRPHHNLSVEIPCAGGRLAGRGWAYLELLPGSEHPVAVDAAPIAEGRIQATLVVDLLPQLPVAAGGSATVAITLADAGSGRWDGTYTATVAGLSDRQLNGLWRDLGQRGEPGFPRRVASGTSASILAVARDVRPVRASGRMLPAWPAGLAPGQRPRLLAADAASLGARMRQAPAETKALRSALSGAGGDVGTLELSPCHGFLAAGWAALAVAGDDGAAAQAAAAVRAASAEIVRIRDARTGAPRLARELAGIAVAYDLSAAAWPAADRDAARALLASESVRLANLRPQPRDPTTHLFGPTGELGDPADGGDSRLAAFRAAALLAALAVEGEPGCAEAAAAADACLRTLRRYIHAAIGGHGSAAATAGFLTAWELVAPAALAARRARGVDLGQRNGLSQVGAWAALVGGRSFDQAPGTGFGLPFACAVADPADLPLLRWAWDASGWTPANPFHALIGILAKPQAAPLPPTALPLAAEDADAGSYVLRSGWDPQRHGALTMDFCTGARPPASNRRGQITFSGFGREWLVRPVEPFGDFAATPTPERFNVVRLGEAAISGLGAALPHRGGTSNRIQVGRDGSGSLSMSAEGFLQRDPASGSWAPFADPGYPLHTPSSWRTVGVDYSGRSGAPALIAIVEGMAGTADREQTWEIALGDLPAEQVAIGTGERNDGTFLVHPEGTPWTMRGAVLYPSTAWIAYQPPDHGHPGKLRAHRAKPNDSNAAMIAASLDRKLVEIAGLIEGNRKEQGADKREDDIGRAVEMDLAAIEAAMLNVKERDRLHLEFYTKMFKHIRSRKMGSPEVPFKARNAWIVILTVQQGPPPPIAPLPLAQDPLCTVGGQTVAYEEFLVKFLAEKP